MAGIDDDFRVRESLMSLMESAGYIPLMYSSAEQFLDSGMLTTVTLLITDVRMSGIDGIELQRRVRLDRPDLPVVFISAHVDDQVCRRALDGGAIRFLYKPFDTADLLLEIDRAFQSQRADKTGIDEEG